ncbi:hypothetical protein [Corynebacterium ureicelerivorans]|uniref:hypothetical protein n=1 Tax=Corynebacterium ureicelerivorans TaxID=401472 RepID=UPI00264F726C|nr:hypothetical protein [Corynebacterium ureicelerivorans]MDN8626138.1 hypothetical protein [Corynebacterium ureicelerivorans]
MDVEFEAVLTHASQRVAGTEYKRISGKRYLAVNHCREQWQVELGAKHHPRGVPYWAPAAARAVAHAVERPGAVVGGFSALALYGLPFLVEGADTLLFCATSKNQQGGACSPALRRPSARPGEVRKVRHRGVTIRAAAPADAVVQALKEITRGGHRWATVGVAGLTKEEVMAIQLVDCARRFLGVQPSQIRAAAAQKINAEWLEGVLARSSCLADSPKETEMRLLVRALAAEYGCTVQEQVPFIVDGVIVTVFDLAIPEIKVAVMYDGAHHGERKQRNKDSSITLKMIRGDWTPARCASETMFECLELIEDLLRKRIHSGKPVR